MTAEVIDFRHRAPVRRAAPLASAPAPAARMSFAELNALIARVVPPMPRPPGADLIDRMEAITRPHIEFMRKIEQLTKGNTLWMG